VSRLVLALALVLAACGASADDARTFELDLDFTQADCAPAQFVGVMIRSVRLELLDDDGAGGVCRRAASCVSITLPSPPVFGDLEDAVAEAMAAVDAPVGEATQVRVKGFSNMDCSGSAGLCGTSALPAPGTPSVSIPISCAVVLPIGCDSAPPACP
jgi:hypothetical protein